MPPGEKPLVWLHGQIKTPPFSQEARIEAGYLLGRLQQGENLRLPHSRPMPSIGRRCHELRVLDKGQDWRIVYRIGADAIVILEVFGKNDPTDATECYRHVQEKAEALRQPGLVDGRICSMNSAKKVRLEAAGWKVGTAAEFLKLNKEEAAFVEMKLSLARCLHALRIRRKLSQSRVAALVGSSQSRVAKMESGDPSVSGDLLLRSVLAIGGSPTEIVRALAPRKKLTPA